jgi:hypothetical protein
LVEHTTENRGVPGSNPGLAIHERSAEPRCPAADSTTSSPSNAIVVKMVRMGSLEAPRSLTITLAKAGVHATVLHSIVVAFLSDAAKDPSAAASAYAEASADHEALAPSTTDLAESLAALPDDRYDPAMVQQIVDALRLADRLWHPSQTPDADSLGASAARIMAALEAAAVRVQMLTIAGPLSAELKDRFKPGQPLLLSEFLDGRVPASAQPQVVDFLAAGSNLLHNGVVDKKNCRVYRLPVSLLGRLWRYPVAPIACLSASAGVLVAAAWIGHQAGDHSRSRLGPWIVAWLAVLVGAALHYGVTIWRRRKTITTDIPVLSTWWQWMMLRPFAGLGILVPPLITVVTLRLLHYGISFSSPRELGTYLLAGYSADSISGMAVKRLDALARTEQRVVEKAVG